jgi:preprotein translocase subunit SecE
MADVKDQKDAAVRRTTPGEFVRQVRQEMRKVTWPSRKETWVSALMVAIMCVVMAVFFLLVDQYFASIVKALTQRQPMDTLQQILVGTFVAALAFTGYRLFLRREGR